MTSRHLLSSWFSKASHHQVMAAAMSIASPISESQPIHPKSSLLVSSSIIVVSLRACVGGVSCRWSESNRYRPKEQRKSGAPDCTAVHSSAPEFTRVRRAACGRRKPQPNGPRKPASKSASRNTGCLESVQSQIAGGSRSFANCSDLVPSALSRRDQSAQAHAALLADRHPDHRTAQVSDCDRSAVACRANRDLVPAGSRRGGRPPLAVHITHGRRLAADRCDPRCRNLPAPRGLSGAGNVR